MLLRQPIQLHFHCFFCKIVVVHINLGHHQETPLSMSCRAIRLNILPVYFVARLVALRLKYLTHYFKGFKVSLTFLSVFLKRY